MEEREEKIEGANDDALVRGKNHGEDGEDQARRWYVLTDGKEVHARAWASREEIEEQAEATRGATDGNLYWTQEGVCEYCGCSEGNASVRTDGMTCWWMDEGKTVCSACATEDPERLNEHLDICGVRDCSREKWRHPGDEEEQELAARE